jgi:DNA-binding beta-propeller fold protein YncE
MRIRVCLYLWVLVLTLIGARSVRADRLALVAGGGEGADGVAASQAKLTGPFGVGFDRSGNTIIVEMLGQRVRKVDPHGILTTIAGTGEKGDGGDGGPALKAQFNGPHSLAVAPNGDIYIADTWNNRVRRIDARTQRITTVVGTGEKGFGGDGGPAVAAKFGGIYCIAFDPRGAKMFLADLDNRRIRVVQMKTGIVSTVAGNGLRGIPTEGAEASAGPLVDPRAVAVDASGNVYILERDGHALRVVDARGKIHTVVGTGRAGLAADSVEARQATLDGPKHLCIDRAGNVIIADTDNHVIRKYLPKEGKIIRLAGTGKSGAAGIDGPPKQAELNQPHGVAVDSAGTLYIVDSLNHRVLRFAP